LATTFTPTLLQNLRRVFSLDNPSPTTSITVGELAGNEVSPQLYTLTGRGPQSAIHVLRHGASVAELAASDLPGVPGGIFTISDASSKKEQYIVVSFADAALVLSIGESVEESGFLTNAPTLVCSALGQDGAMCQVRPSGVRHIQKGQAKQWHFPRLKRIECASANTGQVIIALAGK
jgi:splicing factor 3B subunit 3